MALRISIHALREEGDVGFEPTGNARFISIHALREEGDHRSDSVRPLQRDFNPRPPRGGRRRAPGLVRHPGRFQSTPSARRATADGVCEHFFLYDFNPRPPRGGRQQKLIILRRKADG